MLLCSAFPQLSLLTTCLKIKSILVLLEDPQISEPVYPSTYIHGGNVTICDNLTVCNKAFADLLLTDPDSPGLFESEQPIFVKESMTNNN